MKSLGFKNVYTLKGGILKYLNDHKGKSTEWQGDCFVFDSRFAVNKNLIPIKNKSEWFFHKKD